MLNFLAMVDFDCSIVVLLTKYQQRQCEQMPVTTASSSFSKCFSTVVMLLKKSEMWRSFSKALMRDVNRV